MVNKNNKPPEINLSFGDYKIELRNGKLVVVAPVPVEVHAPDVSNGVDRLVSEADLKAADQQALNKAFKKGRYYPYQGIYLGQYDLPSPHDQNLRRIFHAFAAREPLTWDLPCGKGEIIQKQIFSKNEADEYIARLRKAQEETVFNNSGKRLIHDGIVYFNPVPRIEGRMVMSLRDGKMQAGHHVGLWDRVEQDAYKGEWFIPTCDMIENLFYKNKNLKALKESFNNPKHHSDITNKVLLSSSFDCDVQGAMAFNFATGRVDSIQPSSQYAEVQLVRLVPVY
ncbi:MAG: hypothetical protein VX803_04455 [Pseudomonadota bacterium]|nr:hypothetical protein [Alphaproteobacteria bacterium]MEC9235482.1 hypothetical protein [Pseudomonadota bacterium]|tara:strand:+ start:1503 stop:2348 length:846 start_codon:yes stop_codon:yes gene_type:complete